MRRPASSSRARAAAQPPRPALLRLPAASGADVWPPSCRAVTEAVLAVSPFNALNRVEALRLLARCRAASGRRQAACEALEEAAAAASGVGYVWLEMAALRDLVESSDEPAAARARLDACVGRLPLPHQ